MANQGYGRSKVGTKNSDPAAGLGFCVAEYATALLGLRVKVCGASGRSNTPIASILPDVLLSLASSPFKSAFKILKSKVNKKQVTIVSTVIDITSSCKVVYRYSAYLVGFTDKASIDNAEKAFKSAANLGISICALSWFPCDLVE